jgi:hypothetical protein
MGNLVTVSSTLALTAEAEAVLRLPYDAALTADQANALRPFLSVTLTPPPEINADDIRRNLGPLASALPAQRTDNDTGKLKLAVYITMLSGYPLPALKAACRQVLRELNWFPTPKQLLDRIEAWSDPEAGKLSMIRHRLRRYDEDQARLNAPVKRMTQEDVDALAQSDFGKTLIPLGIACGALIEGENGRLSPSPDNTPSGA